MAKNRMEDYEKDHQRSVYGKEGSSATDCTSSYGSSNNKNSVKTSSCTGKSTTNQSKACGNNGKKEIPKQTDF